MIQSGQKLAYSGVASSAQVAVDVSTRRRTRRRRTTLRLRLGKYGQALVALFKKLAERRQEHSIVGPAQMAEKRERERKLAEEQMYLSRQIWL